MNRLKSNRWARQSGTTLVELSVVIAVILLLVGVLFIGISAWKQGANRSACLVNLSTLQKAYRGYQNMNDDNAALTPPAITDLVTANFFSAPGPVCPSKGTYSPSGAATDPTTNGFVAMGQPAFVCSKAAAPDNHQPVSTANW